MSSPQRVDAVEGPAYITVIRARLATAQTLSFRLCAGVIHRVKDALFLMTVYASSTYNIFLGHTRDFFRHSPAYMLLQTFSFFEAVGLCVDESRVMQTFIEY